MLIGGESRRCSLRNAARRRQSERDQLGRQAAWPLARVLDGTRITGFVMAKVPERFYGMQAKGPKLRELQFLLYEPKPMWGDITPLDADGRLELVRAAAALFSVFHRLSLVIGDVSMNNFLWSANPIGLFLLDCDGVRTVGRRPVTAQAKTVDWDDPFQPPTGPDLDTDRYKLALLIGRVLSRHPQVRPGDQLSFVPRLPERVTGEVAQRFAEAGQAAGTRPDADHWVKALSDRGTIDLGPLPPPRQPANLPRAPVDQPAQRPTIQLRPPSV
jgi:DNA-binding helix-hairpin-helix protein with protein kinase domain